MTKKEIEQQVADTIRKAADAIDPTLNKVGKPPKPVTGEAAQEKHQAALTSFQTIRKGGMNKSLCGQDIPFEEIEAKLKQKPKS